MLQVGHGNDVIKQLAVHRMLPEYLRILAHEFKLLLVHIFPFGLSACQPRFRRRLEPFLELFEILALGHQIEHEIDLILLM